MSADEFLKSEDGKFLGRLKGGKWDGGFVFLDMGQHHRPGDAPLHPSDLEKHKHVTFDYKVDQTFVGPPGPGDRLFGKLSCIFTGFDDVDGSKVPVLFIMSDNVLAMSTKGIMPVGHSQMIQCNQKGLLPPSLTIDEEMSSLMSDLSQYKQQFREWLNGSQEDFVCEFVQRGGAKVTVRFRRNRTTGSGEVKLTGNQRVFGTNSFLLLSGLSDTEEAGSVSAFQSEFGIGEWLQRELEKHPRPLALNFIHENSGMMIESNIVASWYFRFLGAL